MKYIFNYTKDLDTGEYGFVYHKNEHKLGYGGMNTAHEGELIAHDIIEHPHISRIGTIGDELEALGGIWFVRGQWGDLRRDGVGRAHSPEENIAYDVTSMFEHIMNGGKYNLKLACANPRNTEYYDDYISYILDKAKQEISKNYADEENFSLNLRDSYLERARLYMINGWRFAEKRYGDGIFANNLFWSIADQCNALIKDWEGEHVQLVVRVIRKTGQVDVYEQYRKDEY